MTLRACCYPCPLSYFKKLRKLCFTALAVLLMIGMPSIRMRKQPERETGLLVNPLIVTLEITYSFSLQRGGLMFKYQSMINPSLPRRTGALHPYSSRLDFCPLDSQNSLVFKHITEKSYFFNFLFRDQVLQVTPRTEKDMKFLDDLLHNRYSFEVI